MIAPVDTPELWVVVRPPTALMSVLTSAPAAPAPELDGLAGATAAPEFVGVAVILDIGRGPGAPGGGDRGPGQRLGVSSTIAGRRLGVDVGSVRVGVAISDPDGVLATPLVTLRRDAQDRTDLARLVRSAAQPGLKARVAAYLQAR